MLDWSAVFLAEVRQVPRDQAGAGFALFTLAMTAMRLFGDGIVERLSRTRTMVFGGITAAAGFTLATLVLSYAVALGATCWSAWAVPTSCRPCSRWRASSG